MTRDDVIRSTAQHIRTVGLYLAGAIQNLTRRAVIHDQSKWSPEEWPAFEDSTPKLAGLTYGSEEYKAALRAIKPALEHHYKANSHHPEHFESLCAQCGNTESDPCICGGPRLPGGVNQMSLFDVIEMLCDWKAASERHNNGSIVASIKHNTERFNLSPQIVALLENTAREMGWMGGER